MNPLFVCKHKHKLLTCNECKEKFCARCIQLEAHSCPELNARIQDERDNLKKKMVKVEAMKVIKITN